MTLSEAQTLATRMQTDRELADVHVHTRAWPRDEYEVTAVDVYTGRTFGVHAEQGWPEMLASLQQQERYNGRPASSDFIADRVATRQQMRSEGRYS